MKANAANKYIGNLLIILLGLALLVYSATRSLDFISLTLPPDKQVLAWFGLAALDGGLVFWLLSYMFGAKGGGQRGIALLMIVVDFVGACAMFILDTLYRTGEAGLTVALSPGEIRTAVLALSIVIALNIAAAVYFHILDPAIQKKMAEESANDEIESQAIRAVEESAPLLAAELAPILAADWVAKTRAKYAGLIGDVTQLPGGKVIDATARDPEQEPKKQRRKIFFPSKFQRNGKAQAFAAESEQVNPTKADRGRQ